MGILLWAALASLTSSEDQRPTAVLRPSVVVEDGLRPASDRFEPGATLELSLENCVRTVLKRDLDLRLAEIDQEIISTDVRSALGGFDPEFRLSSTGIDQERAVADSFSSGSLQRMQNSATLSGTARTGATWDLTATANYERQRAVGSFQITNPLLNSSVTLSLTQPLLRGAGATVTEATVETNRLLVVRGDRNLMWTVQQKALEAVRAYWNLVFERRSRDTAQTALQVAEELVRNNERKRSAGVMTRLDVLTAEAESARRQEELIRAKSRVGGAEDTLKLLLSPGESLDDWNIHVVPTTTPEQRELQFPSAADVVRNAFVNRTDLSAQAADVAIADLNLAVAENAMLPSLNLSGSYGLAGLGGNTAILQDPTNPFSPAIGIEQDSNSRILDESFTQIGSSQFEEWSVGVEFSYPIGNRAARAGLRRARLEKERSLMAISQTKMTILQDSKTALREVVNGRAQVEAARSSRELAQEQYEAEKIRLENQRSTTFNVRESQRDLFTAIDTEIRAVVDYEIAWATLQQVQGVLAQEYGVLWDTPQLADEGPLR